EFLFSQNSVAFSLQKIDLTKYTGQGNEDVRFRFRLYTDAQGERDGVWIDTISIVVSYDDVVGVENEIVRIPKVFSLEQNYPNPFNPSTKINYAIPMESRVKIQVFNILGETVTTLVDQVVQAGNHSLEWNAGSLTSGIYLYRITAESISGKENFTSVKKMILMK
ncbi:MAG: T9SS type A sorting domain-containing protein, partial [Chlorobi bacterium]|nr:T9SS type A sorting domain-containing protein [Chlorobiota bacterium]